MRKKEFVTAAVVVGIAGVTRCGTWTGTVNRITDRIVGDG